MKEVKKLFISQPMYDISEEDIKTVREDCILYAESRFPQYDFEIIDNYNHPDAPEDAGRLWHLGKSIQQLEKADYIVFGGNWGNSNGCIIEKNIALLYGIEII